MAFSLCACCRFQLNRRAYRHFSGIALLGAAGAQLLEVFKTPLPSQTPTATFTGRFCVDEDILQEAGVNGFRPYSVDPGYTG